MKRSDLASIEKPSRYIGGETNSYNKNLKDVSLRFCLAFPDVYEVSMSHLGHQILYSVLNERKDVFAERSYTPWLDAMDFLNENRLPLVSLETNTPLADFDAIGFTYAYELAATNILAMLDLAGIPLKAKDRKDNHPMILVGGPCAFNPEPMSCFVDAFLIGDGEEAILEISDCLIETKGKTRKEKLERLSTIEGVYVPSFVKVLYYKDGSINEIQSEYAKPRRRIFADINRSDHPIKPLLPNLRTVHERLTVEIARGCTRGCRFCQAGYLYRPVRERDAANISNAIDRGLEQTGFDEISLLSLSSGDYSCIDPLLSALIEAKAPQKISVSLPSLRVESLDEEIMDQIARVKRTGFTIAPEAGSEKLRYLINKCFTDEEFFATIEKVFESGWNLVKLYFMIGLPEETLDDVDAIVELTHKALQIGRSKNKRARINVNVSTFIPKSHTPLQWSRQIDLLEAKRRLGRIKAKMHRGRINLKWQEPEMSLVEGALARGNRQTGNAILNAYRSGCRYDAWTEHFQLLKWEEAFIKAGFSLTECASQVHELSALLPWDVINPAITKEFLIDELEKTKTREPTTDCRTEECLDCGACGGVIDLVLADQKAPGMSFVSTGLSHPSSAAFRYRFRFSKTGNATMISHLDMASAFHRAFRRARLPLAYSQGFSPAPKVSFGPPIPLGAESLDEYVDILLVQRMQPEEIRNRLQPGFLPNGIQILDCWQAPLKSPSLFADVTGARYFVSFEEIIEEKILSVEQIKDGLKEFEKAGSLNIEIIKKKKSKTRDLVEIVESIKRIDDSNVAMKLAMPVTGGVGPYLAIARIFSVPKDHLYKINILKQTTCFRQ